MIQSSCCVQHDIIFSRWPLLNTGPNTSVLRRPLVLLPLHFYNEPNEATMWWKMSSVLSHYVSPTTYKQTSLCEVPLPPASRWNNPPPPFHISIIYTEPARQKKRSNIPELNSVKEATVWLLLSLVWLQNISSKIIMYKQQTSAVFFLHIQIHKHTHTHIPLGYPQTFSACSDLICVKLSLSGCVLQPKACWAVRIQSKTLLYLLFTVQ